MNHVCSKRVAFLALGFLLCAVLALGQSDLGSIAVFVRDPSGCNLDPGHVAAKMAWLRRHMPDDYASARWLLLPGSFVAWRASCELAVDPSNASSSMLLDTGMD